MSAFTKPSARAARCAARIAPSASVVGAAATFSGCTRWPPHITSRPFWSMRIVRPPLNTGAPEIRCSKSTYHMRPAREATTKPKLAGSRPEAAASWSFKAGDDRLDLGLAGVRGRDLDAGPEGAPGQIGPGVDRQRPVGVRLAPALRGGVTGRERRLLTPVEIEGRGVRGLRSDVRAPGVGRGLVLRHDQRTDDQSNG